MCETFALSWQIHCHLPNILKFSYSLCSVNHSASVFTLFHTTYNHSRQVIKAEIETGNETKRNREKLTTSVNNICLAMKSQPPWAVAESYIVVLPTLCRNSVEHEEEVYAFDFSWVTDLINIKESLYNILLINSHKLHNNEPIIMTLQPQKYKSHSTK